MSTPRADAGFTLVEVALTVMIMSLAFVTILEGQAVFMHSTTVRRSSALLDAGVRNYAAAIDAEPYSDCAASYAVAAPAGTTPTVVVDYWQGDLAPATFASTCPGGVDRGAQRIQISLRDTATGQTDQLTIVKRKP